MALVLKCDDLYCPQNFISPLQSDRFAILELYPLVPKEGWLIPFKIILYINALGSFIHDTNDPQANDFTVDRTQLYNLKLSNTKPIHAAVYFCSYWDSNKHTENIHTHSRTFIRFYSSKYKCDIYCRADFSCVYKHNFHLLGYTTYNTYPKEQCNRGALFFLQYLLNNPQYLLYLNSCLFNMQISNKGWCRWAVKEDSFSIKALFKK